MQSRFVYVTYIRTPPAKLWDALTKPEFTRRYWFGVSHETAWKAGSPWKMVLNDGRVSDTGEVLESDPPKRLVLRWRNELSPETRAEGYTRCAFTIEPQGSVVCLRVEHEVDRDNAKIIDNVAGGWPMVLSGLKTLLETGSVLDMGDPTVTA